jgi:tRNA-splicing ligase RtcB
MIAIKTNLMKYQLDPVDIREKIHHSVQRGIPMGFHHNNEKRMDFIKITYGGEVIKLFSECDIENDNVMGNVGDSVWSQLGTLGGGNHFLEISYDEDGFVWIVIHSGSRNIGKKIGDYFNKEAGIQNSLWHSVDTGGIPFLPVGSELGKEYIEWMHFALRFAYLNRSVMMNEVKSCLGYIFPTVEFEKEINIHHNYASEEQHFGKKVWVHRKGATYASFGTTGVIPGSMGAATYITRGLGNPESLHSCSHGAGRKMGRKAFNQIANTAENLADIEKSMEGVVHTAFSKETNRKGKETGLLDVSEAPQAYKDIEDVMANQVDLVRPVHKLLPMINWKDSGD